MWSFIQVSLSLLIVISISTRDVLVDAFVPSSIHHYHNTHATTLPKTIRTIQYSTTTESNNAGETEGLSEVEKLLQKARELRAQAESAESKLHLDLHEKKVAHDAGTDALITELFSQIVSSSSSSSSSHTVAYTTTTYNKEHAMTLSKTIQTKKLSTRKLEQVVQRLHDREVAASGLEHVESSLHHANVQFNRVAERNEEEVKRIGGLIQLLIDAAAFLDEQYLKEQEMKKKDVKHTADIVHWSCGELSHVLSEKAKFLGRGHEEQFKRRLEDYYEAARKKKTES